MTRVPPSPWGRSPRFHLGTVELHAPPEHSHIARLRPTCGDRRVSAALHVAPRLRQVPVECPFQAIPKNLGFDPDPLHAPDVATGRTSRRLGARDRARTWRGRLHSPLPAWILPVVCRDTTRRLRRYTEHTASAGVHGWQVSARGTTSARVGWACVADRKDRPSRASGRIPNRVRSSCGARLRPAWARSPVARARRATARYGPATPRPRIDRSSGWILFVRLPNRNQLVAGHIVHDLGDAAGPPNL